MIINHKIKTVIISPGILNLLSIYFKNTVAIPSSFTILKSSTSMSLSKTKSSRPKYSSYLPLSATSYIFDSVVYVFKDVNFIKSLTFSFHTSYLITLVKINSTIAVMYTSKPKMITSVITEDLPFLSLVR